MLTATEYFNNDFTSFFELMQERDSVSIRRQCYYWDVNRDLAMDVEIPSSLLLGPWTEDNIKLLFWLIKAGARIDWINSTSGEVCWTLSRLFTFLLTSFSWRAKVCKEQSSLGTPPQYTSLSGLA